MVAVLAWLMLNRVKDRVERNEAMLLCSAIGSSCVGINTAPEGVCGDVAFCETDPRSCAGRSDSSSRRSKDHEEGDASCGSIGVVGKTPNESGSFSAWPSSEGATSASQIEVRKLGIDSEESR
jgi:hypothetical protein